MKVSFTHRIPASRDKVLAAYRSTEFYERKQRNSGATAVEILAAEDLPDDAFRLAARVTEPSRVPAFLRQSETDTYLDDSLLDPRAGTLTWKVTPERMADVFLLSGRIDFAADGDATRVTYNTTLEVRIPLVGRKAESIGLAKTEAETAVQAEFLRSWVAGR
ncbi:MAG TPA: DUF2505 family protein [Polyangia bacterium]|nr:DUF2505 family protein [Polyangia bacterium]